MQTTNVHSTDGATTSSALLAATQSTPVAAAAAAPIPHTAPITPSQTRAILRLLSVVRPGNRSAIASAPEAVPLQLSLQSNLQPPLIDPSALLGLLAAAQNASQSAVPSTSIVWSSVTDMTKRSPHVSPNPRSNSSLSAHSDSSQSQTVPVNAPAQAIGHPKLYSLLYQALQPHQEQQLPQPELQAQAQTQRQDYDLHHVQDSPPNGIARSRISFIDSNAVTLPDTTVQTTGFSQILRSEQCGRDDGTEGSLSRRPTGSLTASQRRRHKVGVWSDPGEDGRLASRELHELLVPEKRPRQSLTQVELDVITRLYCEGASTAFAARVLDVSERTIQRMYRDLANQRRQLERKASLRGSNAPAPRQPASLEASSTSSLSSIEGNGTLILKQESRRNTGSDQTPRSSEDLQSGETSRDEHLTEEPGESGSESVSDTDKSEGSEGNRSSYRWADDMRLALVAKTRGRSKKDYSHVDSLIRHLLLQNPNMNGQELRETLQRDFNVSIALTQVYGRRRLILEDKSFVKHLEQIEQYAQHAAALDFQPQLGQRQESVQLQLQQTPLQPFTVRFPASQANSSFACSAIAPPTSLVDHFVPQESEEDSHARVSMSRAPDRPTDSGRDSSLSPSNKRVAIDPTLRII